MFKINLSAYFLILVSLFLFVMLMKERGIKKDCMEAYENRIMQNTVKVQTQLDFFSEKITILRDSVDYYKQIAHVNKLKASHSKAKIKVITAEYTALKEKVDTLPHDSSYVFITGLYPSMTKKEFPLSGEQVHSIHYDIVEGMECAEINEELNFENHYLEQSLIASSAMNVNMESEIDLLNRSMISLYEEISENNKEKQVLKKKIWTNRGIAGVATVLAVVVLL